MSNYRHTEETKKKMSLAKKGKHLSYKRKSLSEEDRKKLSLAHKGKPSPNKGKRMSEEQKQKISKANKGKVSPNKGKKMSDDARLKMSIAKKGIKRGPRSKEVKEKISKALRGRKCPEERKQKISNALKGRHHTEEAKKKISKASKGNTATKGMKFSKESNFQKSRSRIKYLKSLNNNDNTPKFQRSKSEIEFGKQIEKYFNIKLRHSWFLEGKCFDYCYKDNRVLFEIDGTYWHNRPEMIRNDKIKEQIASHNDYKLVRYTLDSVKDAEKLVLTNLTELKHLLVGI